MRNLVVVIALATMAVGCGPRQPRPYAAPAKDAAALETRFADLDLGMTEADVGIVMAKPGAQVAGFSSSTIKRKGTRPDPAPTIVVKAWASEDWKGAIEASFAADGKAVSIGLLRLTPMGADLSR